MYIVQEKHYYKRQASREYLAHNYALFPWDRDNHISQIENGQYKDYLDTTKNKEYPKLYRRQDEPQNGVR